MNQIELTRALLQSKFVCEVSDTEGYNWLKNPSNFNQMSDNLKPLGAKLVKFGEGTVFAALNIAMTDADKKKVVKQFDDIHHNIRPVIDIIIALASTDEYGNTLTIGQRLNQDALVIAANNNTDFETRLKIVVANTTYANKPNDEKVEGLLGRLLKEELVVVSNSNKKIYKVTGKIEYIMRIIEVINENFIPHTEDEGIANQQQGFDL